MGGAWGPSGPPRPSAGVAPAPPEALSLRTFFYFSVLGLRPSTGFDPRYGGSNPSASASQSGLHRVICECRSKRRGTAASRRDHLVSVCGKRRRKRHFGPLSLAAIFGVS